MLKAAILDWAGTMVDFGSRAPFLALQSVFADAGVRVEETEVRRFMGMAKREHVVAMLSQPALASRWIKARGEAWTDADVDALMLALEPAMQREAAACADLVPGAGAAIENLRSQGICIGSTTGYTSNMMTGIRAAAAAQGYQPDCVICANDTLQGRPAPLMIWKALVELGVWPAAAAMVVDDAPVGVEAGRHAGCWTVAVAASGNALGMPHAAFMDLSQGELRERLAPAIEAYVRAGADYVIATVADLPGVAERIRVRMSQGEPPGSTTTESLA